MALPQRRDPNEERRLQEAERRRTYTEPAGGGFFGWWLWIVLVIAVIWFAGWGWGGYGGWWWGRRGVAPVTNNANASPTGVNANGTNSNGANGAAAAVPTGEGVAILNATNKGQFAGQHVDIRDVRVQNKINDRALWIGNTNGNKGNNGLANGAGVNGTNAGAANPNATVGPGGLGVNAGANGTGANAGKQGATTNGNAGATKPGAESAATAEVPTLVVLTGAANAAKGNGGNNAAGNNNGGKNGTETANTAVNGNLNNVNQGELVNVVGTVEKAPSANVAEKQWGLSHDAARQLERDGAYIRATQIMTAGQGTQQ